MLLRIEEGAALVNLRQFLTCTGCSEEVKNKCLPLQTSILSVLALGYTAIASNLIEQQPGRLQLGWDTRESAKIGAFGFLAGGLNLRRLLLKGHKSVFCLNGRMQAEVVWVCYIGVSA